MSHVVEVNLQITSLSALKTAAKRCGLEFAEGKETYRWYGRHVGDYPLPDGFKATDLGKCEHALRVPDKKNAYEIGVVKRRDGQPGYTLLYDFYCGGFGLEEKVGKQCSELCQQYAKAVIEETIGYEFSVTHEERNEDGALVLTLSQGGAW